MTEFKRGDRVWHRNLQMVGIFEARDQWDKETAEVYFPDLDEGRRITYAQLEPAGDR